MGSRLNFVDSQIFDEEASTVSMETKQCSTNCHQKQALGPHPRLDGIDYQLRREWSIPCAVANLEGTIWPSPRVHQ